MNAPHRTRPPKWAFSTPRLALALLATALACTSLADTLANVIARHNPQLAHRLAPWDGIVTARLANADFTLTPTADREAPAILLARQALRNEAVAVDALNVLGLQAQMRNERERAQSYFRYSLLLSRRELPARLWAIEEAVMRGDIREALNNYNLALRTSKDATELLFPILTRALAEKQIRRELLHISIRQPAWMNDFVHYVARSREEPAGSASLFLERASGNLPIAEDDWSALVGKLLYADMPEYAWKIYAARNPGASRDGLRDPNFDSSPLEPTGFDWAVLDYASIQKERGTAYLEYSVPTTQSGPVIRQILLLSPGRYRLSGTAQTFEMPKDAPPYWALKCSDGRAEGKVNLPIAYENPTTFSGTLNVSQNCPTQLLELIVRPSDALAGVSGRISRLRLESY